jgi:hypothetical protein
MPSDNARIQRRQRLPFGVETSHDLLAVQPRSKHLHGHMPANRRVLGRAVHDAVRAFADARFQFVSLQPNRKNFRPSGEQRQPGRAVHEFCRKRCALARERFDASAQR